ncbi:MAG: tRNA 2-thiouridine(34) synthase MnmA [Candidatus Pacebacteria bacterium]|jgi:tRNA-specific 2-thiouridylase|nr:tRNA 2-thiouridine(34) synthase MnmA [Candidatus Paceibacterota bacterium]
MKVDPKKTTPVVFVGLSGGVDSSVTAALLQKAGYAVVGVFIKVWQPDFIECTWREERRDAMRVAAHLGIPFLTFDLEKEYKQGVADYMIREYERGRTPNPDVMCNKEVKFGAFLEKALAMGADFVATGHYARGGIDPKSGKHMLKTGSDTEKDQSYFLWTLKQEQLSRILFPVGALKKPEVRKYAGAFELPTETKKDSQGVCFLGKLDMKEFLKHYIVAQKGPVLDMSGKIIGSHEGAVFYTIGERHGFVISEKHSDDAPLYIVAKDIKNNTITVASRQTVMQKKDSISEIDIESINWIAQAPKVGDRVFARFRYRQELLPCIITSLKERSVVVSCTATQEVISPGQSIVFYDGDICLGGGIIS